jgi:hypothetical protein
MKGLLTFESILLLLFALFNVRGLCAKQRRVTITSGVRSGLKHASFWI